MSRFELGKLGETNKERAGNLGLFALGITYGLVRAPFNLRQLRHIEQARLAALPSPSPQLELEAPLTDNVIELPRALGATAVLEDLVA